MVPPELKNLNDIDIFKSDVRNTMRMYIMSALYAQYRLCEYQ